MLNIGFTMQISTPMRAPSWLSRRRLLEEKLSGLHKCTDLHHVKQVFTQILKADLHHDLYVAPKLIAAFSNCRQIALAVHVFNQIEEPNTHLYNALIRAHVQNAQLSQAFSAFLHMQKNWANPDNFTYSFLVKGCGSHSWLTGIQMIHSHVEKLGFYADMFVPNSLLDAYSKCGKPGLNAARKLFVLMRERDVVSWNTMIGGLVKACELEEARKLFDEMPDRDMVSWNTILDGYVKAGEMNIAFELFEKMPERNVFSWSTLISGYTKANNLEMASMLFDKMPFKKSVVPWTIIIAGYAEKGLTKEASSLYNQMEKTGLMPDEGTVISILCACAESGMLTLGKKVHDSITKTRFECNTLVLNALIDMYWKCGSLDTALSIFNGMTDRDMVSWNSMLHGLAMHGRGEKALELFSRMMPEGFKPDRITFVSVLCACTHAGLTGEGRKYFYSMYRDYGIVPEIEHYGCMIDLLGRGGCLKEAFRLVHTMPMEPNVVIWGSLLMACRMHNAVELANEVKNHLLKLKPSDPGIFSLLSNIYAGARDWGSVANARLALKNAGVQKPSGSSSIEVEDNVHEFTVFDQSHPQCDVIYQMMDRLVEDLTQVGYVPNVHEEMVDFTESVVDGLL